jgi:hypothetical protein
VPDHRHQTSLRGTKVTPRPAPENPDYTAVNYTYAGREGHIHEVVQIGGRELAKVGFDDRKIVYYFLDDLEREDAAPKRTFHDLPDPRP